MQKKVILNQTLINIILERLCHQLIEQHGNFADTVLIGLQPRGAALAYRLEKMLREKGVNNIQMGLLDITFFRDDFRRRETPLHPNQTKIDFLVEDKRVIFIDDVLYSGRSVRAALDAIHSFGRPRSIELLVLIDRRFSRKLPIQPSFCGHTVDAIDSERVLVEWKENNQTDQISIIPYEST
ncbi:MAG: bifunctional pyr operon transcriptional regulator/uracil phosphoribosyltransferase PyrR [Flavobacteriales bacterium]|nr:MAG: bifunctional pyr operon transcriptional regulator/uracil phosphoribosyltransferase PyrR [Flavobacteriales bacterium]